MSGSKKFRWCWTLAALVLYVTPVLLGHGCSCLAAIGIIKQEEGGGSPAESNAVISGNTLKHKTNSYELVVIDGKLYAKNTKGDLSPVLISKDSEGNLYMTVHDYLITNEPLTVESWPDGFSLDSNQSDSSSYPTGTAVQGSWPSGFSQESNKSDSAAGHESAPSYP